VRSPYARVSSRNATQRNDPPQIPVAALVDGKLANNNGDDYRDARSSALQEASRIGFAALDEESRTLRLAVRDY
jgi:hypothetical protein